MLSRASNSCRNFIIKYPKTSVMLTFLFVIALISLISAVTGYTSMDPVKAATTAQAAHRNIIKIVMGALFLGAASICGVICKKQKDAKRKAVENT